MKPRNPEGPRATRLLAYENARPSESRLPIPVTGSARKDSAVRVSLSSNHNVKEPVGRGRLPPPEPPMEANPPSGVNDSRSVSPRSPGSCSASVRRIARSRIISQDERTTRANGLSKEQPPTCQGHETPRWTVFAFALDRGYEATFLPECAAKLPFVNGVVTIRG